MPKKELLVVVSKVKAYAKEKDASVSAESMEYLTGEVQKLLDKGIAEAKACGKKVVKPQHFGAASEE